jgi:hypothetical protein
MLKALSSSLDVTIRNAVLKKFLKKKKPLQKVPRIKRQMDQVLRKDPVLCSK